MSSNQEDNTSPLLQRRVRKRRIEKQTLSQHDTKPVKNDKLTSEKKDNLNPECHEKLKEDIKELEKELEKLEKIEEESEEDSEETMINFMINFKKKKLSLPPSCHCVICFVYMGEMNPRQNCRKIRCEYDFLDENEMLQIQVFNLRSSPYYSDYTFYGYPTYHNTIQKFIDDNYIEYPDEK